MKILKVTFFLVDAHLKNALKSGRNVSAGVAQLLFLIYLFFVGLKTPDYLIALNDAGLGISWFEFLKILLIIIFSIAIFKEFIPVYAFKINVLPVYHPLNQFTGTSLTLIFNIFTRGNIAIQSLIAGIWLAFPEIDPLQLIYIEILMLTGFFISINLKTLLENTIPKAYKYLITNVLAYSSVVLLIYFLNINAYSNIILPVLLAVTLGLIAFKMEKIGIGNSSYKIFGLVTGKKIKLSAIVAFLLRTKKIKTALSIGLLAKIIALLFMIFVEYLYDEKRWVGEYFIVCFFLSPFLTFNFLNNLYGFNRNLWLNTELAGGDYKNHNSIFKRIFVRLILIDAMITIPTIIIARFRLIDTILFYGTSCLVFYFIAFLISSYLPKKVNRVYLTLAGPASFLTQFTVFIPAILMLPVLSKWFYGINLILITILYLLYKYLHNQKLFNQSKYKLFLKLFRT